MDPIAKRVGSYKRLVRPYLDGGSPYLPSPLGSVVLSLLRSTWMTSDQTEMTTVPLVLTGSVQRACAACLLLSEQACLAGLGLSCPFPEVGTVRGCVLLHGERPRLEGGVVANPDLSACPGLLSLTEPRSFGL